MTHHGMAKWTEVYPFDEILYAQLSIIYKGYITKYKILTELKTSISFTLNILLLMQTWDFFFPYHPIPQLSRFNSDANNLESAQPPRTKGSIPQDCPPIQMPVANLRYLYF